MARTPLRQYRYPELALYPNGPEQLSHLALDVENDVQGLDERLDRQGSGFYTLNISTSGVSPGANLGQVSIPSWPVNSALLLEFHGQSGFDYLDRLVAADFSISPSSGSVTLIDSPRQLSFCFAGRWATVAAAAQVTLPAGVSATAAALSGSDGTSYFRGLFKITRF